MGDNASALEDAAEQLEDAAEAVEDAADDAIEAPADAADAIDTTPIADAIGDAADGITHLDHESRISTLEATIAGLASATHEHYEYARGDHEHIDLTPEPDIPVPPAPEEIETSDEPTDEPPTRTHPLLARPFANKG